MDISETKFKYKCPKHPDFKIEFFSIDNLDTNQDDSNLFLCPDCVCNSTFNQPNYLLIKKIIKCGTNSILPKWPPVNDYQIINQLTKIATGNEEIQSIIAQIEKYFTDLKADILKQIDICQKKMIQSAQELPQNKTQIYNKYQELSQIKELRSIIVDNKTDLLEKEYKCRMLVEKIISEKKSINEQLNSLLNQHKQQQILFNLKSSLEMKESILKTISSINFFERFIAPIDNNNNNNNKSSNNNNKIQLDVELVKTNFNYKYNRTTEITKNEDNQQQVLIKQSKNWKNIVSNIQLENNKKYIFRLEIQLPTVDQRCMIGLMKDADIDNKSGYTNKLSCFLKNINQQIAKHPNYNHGIDNLIKGDAFQLSENNVIEMRVCLEDEILEVMDYPNYSSKLTLDNQQKNNLKNENFRLYLGMHELNSKIILKEAFTVKSFE